MAETAFLDLMSYARGAELANQANWRDSINALNQRTAESNLYRQEQVFNTQFPVQQALAESQLATLEANKASAQFQADINQQLLAVPEAQRAGHITERLQGFLSSASPQAAQMTQAFAQRKAVDAFKAGDTATGTAWLTAIGDANAAQRLRGTAQWSDPALAYDPINLAAAGAVPVEGRPGMVTAYGQQIPADVFVQVQRQRNADALANAPAALAPAFAQARQLQGRMDLGAQMAPAYSDVGLRQYLDPTTGLTFVIPAPAVSPVYPESVARRYPPPAALPAPTGATGAPMAVQPPVAVAPQPAAVAAPSAPIAAAPLSYESALQEAYQRWQAEARGNRTWYGTVQYQGPAAQARELQAQRLYESLLAMPPVSPADTRWQLLLGGANWITQ